MSFLLDNLPNEGLLELPTSPTKISPPPTYLALHNTDAPPGQVIETDQTNLLVRSLQQKRKSLQNVVMDKKDKPEPPKPSKRPNEEASAKPDTSETAPKKTKSAPPVPSTSASTSVTSSSSSTAATSNHTSDINWSQLHSLTVTELKALLKQRNLPVTGTKEVLISRLRQHKSQQDSKKAKDDELKSLFEA